MITKTEKGFLKASVIENNITAIWSIKIIQDLFTQTSHIDFSYAP